MSEKNSAAIIVARFLKSNSYTETLDAFLREAELPPDAGTVNNKDDWTIEKILDEKRIYDLNVNFEKLGTANEDYSWKLPGAVTTRPPPGNTLSTGW
ncbi:MAG: hypothetical protein M1834_002725 [Cirrosporium novae-zelandiae]|nr:MAG: hypothetical protein M1834_002725 [Cirrosporium novae-zelandiae]